MPPSEHWMMNVPTDATGRMEVLATRPVLWEYLLFGAVLHAGLQRTEPKWRDFHLGYTMSIGPVVAKSELRAAFSERMSRASFIVANLEKIISKPAQDAAFGLPGVTGDALLVEHMGDRLLGMYEQMLDWADEVRSLRVPDGAEELREVASSFVARPIAAVRTFVEDYTSFLEGTLVRLKDGETSPITISMGLVFDVPDRMAKQYRKLLNKATR